MKRQDAHALLNEYVTSDSLKTHCLGVAVCMEAYAHKWGEDPETYFVTGLLHDFDWEIHPTLEQHPRDGVKILQEKGVSEEICQAIMGHSVHTGVSRETKLAQTLFAVDELSGLMIALAKVRPGNFEGMSPKSVKKALKKKDFAANVNRDEVTQGITELGVEPDAHYQLCIEALTQHAQELGF